MKSLSYSIIILFISVITLHANWKRLCIPTIKSLYAIDFYDQNYGLVVGDQGTILRTTDGGKTWSKIPIIYSHNLRSVHFISADTAYIGGIDKMILRTSDGGLSWEYINNGTEGNGVGDININAIFFTSSSTGYVGGYHDIPLCVANKCYVGISRTDNSGIDWDNQQHMVFPTPVGVFANLFDGITSIHFTDDTIGFYTAAGLHENGRVIGKTTNAGDTWTKLYDLVPVSGATNYRYNDIRFINHDTGFVAGYYKNSSEKSFAYLLKTTNAGTSWDTIAPTRDADIRLKAIHFFDENNGYMIGNRYSAGYGSAALPFAQKIYRTVNGGSSWTSIYYSTLIGSNVINDVYYLNDTTAYIVGENGTILVNEKTSFGVSFDDEIGDTACNDGLFTFYNCSTPGYSNPPYNSCSNKYVWYVNGDSVSNQQHLEYEFDTAGTYYIKLKASTFCQSIFPTNVDSFEKQIVLIHPANASFDGHKDTINLGTSLNLINTSTYTDSITWSIHSISEEALFNNQQQITYTFDQIGIYSILMESFGINQCKKHKDFAEKTVFVVDSSLLFNFLQDFSSQSVLQLYPNPSTGLINVFVNIVENNHVSLEVIDAKGSIVSAKYFDSSFNNNAHQFTITFPGIYIVRVNAHGQTFYKKLLITD